MKKLTINEQIFLIAIWHLREEAYGIKIREKIKELTGNEILFGTLYNTLEYLSKKGFVDSQRKDPSMDSQNTKRIFYRITPKGIQALQNARELQESLWKGIPELVKERE